MDYQILIFYFGYPDSSDFGFDQVFGQDDVLEITTAEDNPDLVESNLGHDEVYLTNALSVTVAIITENNKVVDLVTVGDVCVLVT